jgi:two-component system phosphate regulon response regulator PhoB
VLIVDDDSTTQIVAYALSRTGFEVAQATDARGALASISRRRPDLAIIEWMLPGVSGLELMHSIKQMPSVAGVPIIIVSPRAEEQDKVLGLNAGADDYVTKPFSPRELIARVRAVLRRVYRDCSHGVLRADRLVLDTTVQRVSVGNDTVPLGPLEFRLLSFLMTHRERVHTRAQLLDRVWGTHAPRDERTVNVEISRLRRALGAFGCDAYIQTAHGAGYRFSTKTA